MSVRFQSLAALTLLTASCSCGASEPPLAVTPSVPAPSAPDFEVHEWGLVRGTAADTIMISGPHAPEPPMVVTKPVLYFHLAPEHREAERDALVVDVDARIPGGRVVEHWPTMGGDPGSVASWHGVVIQSGSCSGSRYPSLAEDPCTRVTDGCEAATLAIVETTDSDCAFWPSPEGDGPTQAWNHLFYRGELTARPALPLRLEVRPDGSLSITATGTEPIPGTLLRIRRSNGAAGVTNAADVITPPAPGETTVAPVPSGTWAVAAEALDASLHAAGLTDAETAAFRAAWDETLFGSGVVAAITTRTVATTTPMAPPPPTTEVLYVLPLGAADAVAELTITPAPTAIRRAIVMWLDETSGP